LAHAHGDNFGGTLSVSLGEGFLGARKGRNWGEGANYGANLESPESVNAAN